MSTGQDLSTIIGFDLDGRGIKQANADLDEHAKGWDRVDQVTSRIGSNVDRMAGRLAGLSGAVGLGAVIADFVRLDDVASRAALSVGAATGRSGFSPYATALRGAAIATSTDSRQLGSAMIGLQGSVGGMGGPASWQGLGTGLGNFSRAYGVEIPTLGADLQQMLMSQKLGAGSSQQLLSTIANQAARAGMTGQTAQVLQAVTMATGLVGGLHPGQVAGTASAQLGAMYGGAAAGNRAFRDPSLFAQGVGGVDQGITQAYRDPRMEAVLTMAGIGYRDQRAGLAGPHGRQTAQKLLNYAQSTYGKGTTEEDLFLRSNFGDVSADMLQALSSGKKTWDQLSKPGNLAATGADTQRRAQSDQDTSGANIQKKREQAGDLAQGPLGAIESVLDGLSATDLLAIAGGGAAARKILPRVLKGLKRRAAAKVVEEAAAGGAGAAGGAVGGFDAAAASEAVRRAATGAGSSAAEGAGARAAAGLGARAGLKFLGAGVGALADALIFPSKAGEDPKALAQFSARNQWGYLSKKFGQDWYNNPDAIAYARKHGEIDVVGGDKTKSDWWLRSAIQQARKGAKGGRDPSEVFADAVDKFTKAILGALPDAAKAHRKGASWDGGGGLNAGGAASSNDSLGNGMVLARMISGTSGSASGAGGATPASYTTPAGATGGSPLASNGGGTSDVGGGSWASCTMTWYDPALGGTNSSGGKADPHSKMSNGQPYQASSMTCAAPPSYAFGTMIAFRYKGRTVTCQVTDRGGAITGSHFDLSRAAADAIGLRAAGRDTGQFKVVGQSSGSKKTTSSAGTKSSGGSGGASGGSGGSSGSGGGSTVEDSQKGSKDVTYAHPHATAASWVSQPAVAHPAASFGHGAGDIVVQIDGMNIDRRRRLTRGS